MTDKKLGTLIARNKKKITTGIVTDGQVRKLSSKNVFLNLLDKRFIIIYFSVIRR